MKRTIPSVLIVALCLLQACSWVHTKNIRDVDPIPSPKFQCPEDEGLFPDPTDCKKFYQCFNHLAWQSKCPADLYFNPILKVCDYKDNVDCTPDTIKSVAAIRHQQSMEMDDNFSCPSASGYFPVSPDACEANYYLCVDNVSYAQTCPGNFVFDPLLQACQTADRASCGKTSPQTTMTPTSPKPFSCPSASGYFPVSPDACEANYYLCVDNTPYPQTCPGNLVFDPKIQACQIADRASCAPGTSTEPTKPTTVPTEPTTGPTEPTTIPTEPTTVPTQPTTVPTEPTTVPTEPTTPRVTTNMPTTTGPFKCEEGVDGYFARPGHCDQFIICSNGFAYIMNCPAGLYFNPATKVCDYDSIVDCN